MRFARVTATITLGLLGYAAVAGTLRTVMYAVALRWVPTDREREIAAIRAAIAANSY